MPSVRERILAQLETELAGVAGVTVERDAALPTSVPAGGLLVLRDGGDSDPRRTFNGIDDLTLSADVEVYQGSDPGADLDTLRAAVTAALLAAPTHGDLAIDTTPAGTTPLNPLQVEGARPFEAVSLAFTVRYWTAEGDPNALAP